MNTLLVATYGYVSREELSAPLEGNWQLHFAHDGFTASEMLEKLRPDALVIDLNLPYRDGLSILMEHMTDLPPIVAVISDDYDNYEIETLHSLGIHMILEYPCSQFDIGRHINAQNMSRLGLNTACGMHLNHLGISMKTDGYMYLYTAIPLCTNCSAVRFQKEIYPEVMRRCNACSVESVEHSIRFSIKDAWKHRNPQIWAKYFQGADAPDAKCPTSKVFITTIARMLDKA